MRPPRMRVALFGRSLAGFTLANAMERAGHEVQMLSDPAELASFEALIIAVGDARLEATVELLEPHVHHGLIVFHTCALARCPSARSARNARLCRCGTRPICTHALGRDHPGRAGRDCGGT